MVVRNKKFCISYLVSSISFELYEIRTTNNEQRAGLLWAK